MDQSGQGPKESPEITLGLLEAIERNSGLTQRHMASELGIALGLLHAYMKRCVNKGLVKVQQVPPRRFAYYLTPHGFMEKSRLTAEYLSHSMKLFKRTRSFFADTFESIRGQGVTALILAGPEDMAEVVRLMAQEFGIVVVGTIPIDLAEPVIEAANRIALQLTDMAPDVAVLITDFARADQLTEALAPRLGPGRLISR